MKPDYAQPDLQQDLDEAWAHYLDSDKVSFEAREILTEGSGCKRIFQAGLYYGFAYGYTKFQEHVGIDEKEDDNDR